MTANPTKTEGSMSDDNENSPEASQLTEEVKYPSTVEPEPITETNSQQESASSFKWGKTLLGLGVFTLLTGNILVLTNHLKPSSSMAGMEGMDHGDMSHDEMMAVDGSFNPNPVRVETVKPQVLEASVSYTGTIKPYEEIMVYPRVAGQLTNYSVYPGDRVTAGQPIATLDASELTTGVAEAAAEVSTMETDLEMSKIEVDEQKSEIAQAEMVLEVVDSNGNPVKVESLDVSATMPMDGMEDMIGKVEVTPAEEPGRFKATTYFGMQGTWNVVASVKDSQYQANQEFSFEVK